MLNNFRIKLVSFLSCFVLIPLCALAERPSLTLAEVNGHKITSLDVDGIIAKEFATQEKLLEESSKHFLRLKIVNRLIDNHLLASKAEASLGLEKSELKSLSENELISRYLDERVLSDLSVSSKDIGKDWSTAEERRVRIIFLDKGQEEKAIKLRAEIAAEPKLFAELAKQNSVAPSRLKGGDMGYLTVNQLPEEISKQVFALNEGELSEVILFADGLAIALVDEVKIDSDPGTKANFAIKNLRKNKSEELIREHLKLLRNEAKIIVYID